jgi:hypothetical protein
LRRLGALAATSPRFRFRCEAGVVKKDDDMVVVAV